MNWPLLVSGVKTKFKNLRYPVQISPRAVPELCALRVDDAAENIIVGGAVTLSALEHFIAELEGGANPALPPYALRGATAVRHMLRWFASNQIR